MISIHPAIYLLLTMACAGSGKIIVPADTDTGDSSTIDTAPLEPSTEDTSIADTNDTVDTEPEVVPVACDIEWHFTTPTEYEFYLVGDVVDATVQIDALNDYTGYSINGKIDW